ncbi:MAG: hypothetical protein M0Z83_11605 [Betaproteobacteria bacterium]|nr:hypothetical protein [Betaproteobacteria bacterium]
MLMKYSAVAVTCISLLSTGCADLINQGYLKPINTYNRATDARINVYQYASAYGGDRIVLVYPNKIPNQILKPSLFFGYPVINKNLAYKPPTNIYQIQHFRPYEPYAPHAKVYMYTLIVRNEQLTTLVGTIYDSISEPPDGCSPTFATFTPKAGHNYATYLMNIGGTLDTCAYLQVVELKDEAGVVKEVPVKDITRIGAAEAILKYEDKSK